MNPARLVFTLMFAFTSRLAFAEDELQCALQARVREKVLDTATTPNTNKVLSKIGDYIENKTVTGLENEGKHIENETLAGCPASCLSQENDTFHICEAAAKAKLLDVSTDISCATSIYKLASDGCISKTVSCLNHSLTKEICGLVVDAFDTDCNLDLGGLQLLCKKAPQPSKHKRQSCTCNNQCFNSACGRLEAGADSLVCCPSGENDLYAGFDYCTKMPNGNACFSDAMCASGFCEGDSGGLAQGKCSTPQPAGSTCVQNSGCSNQACARAQAGAESLVCCPSGETDLYAAFDYCTKMPDDNACFSDAMCKSGICAGNDGGNAKGTCASELPAGSKCTKNIECTNRACGRREAGTENLVCCPSGETGLYAAFDYCTKMPDGSTCLSDAMCKSGICSGNSGGVAKGTCSSLLPAGSECTKNVECTNGACGRSEASAGVSTCCPSGVTDLYAGYDYCTGMPSGTSCWSDAMCAGGDCKGNWDGLSKGNCN
jgi:hypothetical protein